MIGRTVPRVVWEFVAATNARDREWLAALFADGCRVDACGYLAGGRAAVASWAAAELFSAEATLSVLSVETVGASTVVLAEATECGCTHTCELRFDVTGDLITFLTITVPPTIGSRNASRTTEAADPFARRS